MSKTSIHIFALAAHGKGISGGDRIFIEFAKNWSKKYPVTIYLWREGYEMCKRAGLLQSKDLRFKILDLGIWCQLGFAVCYVSRIIASIIEALKLAFYHKSYLVNHKSTIIYSASEFWMDSLPAFLLKLRFPKIKWAAAWYQTAPKPLKGFSGSLPYFLVQLPIKPLIGRFANFVLVNNDGEKKQFQEGVVVLGAIDLKSIKIWKSKFKNLPKIYDGVFQGRFHPQKGVLELVDIWKLVVSKKPDAKLVIIGDGPLMESVKRKVQSVKLENNIILKGYLFEGEEKYKIFAQSKIVVHPAIFDSGGMASAEAMAFGLPCIGFNLQSYKYYYPKGMVKIHLKDLDGFAEKIIELLSDEGLYQKVSKEALQLINNTWSWEYRSRQILSAMLQ